jgi:uncharacterized membrane protein YcaP (DUF421 family)
MDIVVRAAVIYLFLLLLIRLTGKRAMAQLTPFDFVLVLIVSEAAQQGLSGDDYSLVNSMVLVTTLVAIDVGLARWKQRSPRVQKLLDDAPDVVVSHGRVLQRRMERERVTEDEVLSAARMLHGLERMEQIRYAVVETDGEISIVPEPDAAPA